MATVHEKLEKANKKLESLKAHRKDIDENIKKVEADVAKYQSIIDKAKFDELANTLQVSGLSLDDMVTAVKNGDFLALQEKIKDQAK